MRTLVCIPCMDMVHAVFMRSVVQMEKVGETDVESLSGSLIYDARNELLQKAIDENYDRVLWLDSDMSFKPDLLKRLEADLVDGRDFVSGLYFKRKQPITPTIYKNCDVYNLGEGGLSPMAVPYWDYPEDKVFQIEACGFGAVLMTMDGIKRTVDRFGRMPFMPVAGFGEDLSFCLRWREAGGMLWCDSGARLDHIGFHAYNEEDYLKARRETI